MAETIISEQPLAEPPGFGPKGRARPSSFSSTPHVAVTSSPELGSHSSSIRWGYRRARLVASRGARVVCQSLS